MCFNKLHSNTKKMTVIEHENIYAFMKQSLDFQKMGFFWKN